SRDDFINRKGHAGPFYATPGAQMIGEWEFDYSIIVGQDEIPAYQQSWNFEAPLCAAGTGIHAGNLPPSGSFVEVMPEEFVVSAVKQTDDRKGWIVRGYNITDKKINVGLRPWRAFKNVWRVNLAEERIGVLKPDREGAVTIPVRGHEIATVKFWD
ncbi:MAG: glycosyl hydrolase-related protein, partial [Chloroflexota bacterium]